MKRRGCALLVAAIICALPALDAGGQERRGPPSGVAPATGGMAGDPLMQSAQTWDANRDGVYTCDEWKQHAARLFNRADADRNGVLTAREFDTLKQSDPAFRSADLGYFDDNRDGSIARAEFVDKRSPLFARYDRNGDCRITAEEMRGGDRLSAGGPRARPTLGPGGVGSKIQF